MTDTGIPFENNGAPGERRSPQQERARALQADIRGDQIGIRRLPEQYLPIALASLARNLHDDYRDEHRVRTAEGESFRADWREVAIDRSWKRARKAEGEFGDTFRRNEINLPELSYSQLPESIQQEYQRRAAPLLARFHQAISSRTFNDAFVEDLAADLYTQGKADQQIAFGDPRVSEKERDTYRAMIVSAGYAYLRGNYALSEDRREFDRSHYEARQKLSSPYYLPSTQEVVDAFSFTPLPGDSDGMTDFMTFLKEENKNYFGPAGTSEYPTQEYIAGLARHLQQQIRELGANSSDKITILEVGANNGRLASFLKQALIPFFGSEEVFKNVVQIIATDKFPIKSPDLPQFYPVEALAYKAAIDKYNPQIVIGSWMPTTRLMNEDDTRGTIEDDWTVSTRANPFVKGIYVIGDPDELDVHPESGKDGFQSTELGLSQYQFSYRDTASHPHKSRTHFLKRK